MASPIDRKPYHGLHRKLVLAFDVGTTYSGISYSILDPGYVPQIKGVNRYVLAYISSKPCSSHSRFPAQENVGGDSKIPSILWYDQQGRVRAVGAEALQASILEKAEDEGWVKLEWCLVLSSLRCFRRLREPLTGGNFISVLGTWSRLKLMIIISRSCPEGNLPLRFLGIS